MGRPKRTPAGGKTPKAKSRPPFKQHRRDSPTVHRATSMDSGYAHNITQPIDKRALFLDQGLMDKLHDSHSINVKLIEDGTVAELVKNVYTHQEVFSNLTLMPSYSFTIRVEEAALSHDQSPYLILGLTCQDPKSNSKPLLGKPDTWSMNTQGGNRYENGTKVYKCDKRWTQMFGNSHKLSERDTVTITLNTDMTVSIAINKDVVDNVFTRLLPVKKPLWVVMMLKVKRIRVIQREIDTLHERHGKDVKLSEDRTVADVDHVNNQVFSKLPLQPGNMFTVRVEEGTAPGTPHIVLGLTCRDPTSWFIPGVCGTSDTWCMKTENGLCYIGVKDATPCGMWKQNFDDEHHLSDGDNVTLTLNMDMSVSISINKKVVDNVFTGLPGKPLWVVIQLWVKKIRVIPQELTLYKPKKIKLVTVTSSHQKDFVQTEKNEDVGQPGVYPMFRARKGRVCIIAIPEFMKVKNITPLQGYRTDALRLSQLWDQMGFDVYTPIVDSEDITSKKITKIVENFATMLKKSDQMAVLCIMSHGGDGFVCGADGEKVYITELAQYMNNEHCKVMAHKPKLILVQACQGGKKDKGVTVAAGGTISDPKAPEAVPPSLIPSISDMVICYPAMAGYVSWVNKLSEKIMKDNPLKEDWIDPDCGSVLVKIFTKVFAKGCHNKELYDLTLQINGLVYEEIIKYENENSYIVEKAKQMPYWSHSLRKKLYFLPCPRGKHGKDWK